MMRDTQKRNNHDFENGEPYTCCSLLRIHELVFLCSSRHTVFHRQTLHIYRIHSNECV